MKLKKIRGKKGQFADAIFAVIIIVIIGIILFFFSHLNHQIYSSLDEYFGNNSQEEAQDAIQNIDSLETSQMWDWGFLAIFIGLILQMLLLSYATRINVSFFWIFVILTIVTLIVGVVLSNIWIEIAANPEFSETITRFPITNTLLGSYFPTVIVVISFIVMLALFGKPPE